jgi:hypothetical protein
MPSVIEIVEWLKRSWTTLGWMPRLRARVAEAAQREMREVPLRDAAEEHCAHGVGLEPLALGLLEHEAMIVEA